MRLLGLQFGDDHTQKSSVVNITHVDPTLGQHGVRISMWLLVLFVCLSTMDLGLLVGLVATR